MLDNPVNLVDPSGKNPAPNPVKGCKLYDADGYCVLGGAGNGGWPVFNENEQNPCANWEICLLAAVIMAETNRGTYSNYWMKIIAWTYLNRVSLIKKQDTLWKAVKGVQSAASCYYSKCDGTNSNYPIYPGLPDDPTIEELAAYWSDVYSMGSKGLFASGWKQAYMNAKNAYENWSTYGTGSSADPTSQYVKGCATDFRMVKEEEPGDYWASYVNPGRPHFRYADLGSQFIPGLGGSRHMFISNFEYSTAVDLEKNQQPPNW